jgi:hypothetical protein
VKNKKTTNYNNKGFDYTQIYLFAVKNIGTGSFIKLCLNQQGV